MRKQFIKATVGILLCSFLFPASAFAESARQMVQSGNNAYQAGDYKKSLEDYDKAAVAEPDSPVILFNRGNAFYKREAYDDAIKAFEQAAVQSIQTDDQNLEAKSRFNIGNSAYRKAEILRSTDLQKSVEIYEQSAENYQAAHDFAALNYGMGHHSDAHAFFGDMLGSMGETSVLACLFGAFVLIYTGVGSWRTMLGMVLGAFGAATLFQVGAENIGMDVGAWNPAKYAFPAYKHLLIGAFAFGCVFMATDPVSSPGTALGRWLYGLLVGVVVIIIRAINPAYPEGVMLAILLGNVFAPLIDHYVVRNYRRRRRVRA